MRLAKFIADAGLCSRREAEKLIAQGIVKVDGVIVNTPVYNVDSGNIVEVSGQKLKADNIAKLWVYHKPAGLITTHYDPQGRPTVFDNLKNRLPRVISVGRLDINSEGLLLLTNCGELARYLESPSNKIERIYKVRAFGNNSMIESRNKVIKIAGMLYRPKMIKQITKGAKNSWYEVVLTEGKNREIRKIFEHFGLRVNKLIRISFGKYSLNGLKVDEFEEVMIDENYQWKT